MAQQENNEKLVWFLAGMAVGAALGILFAPRSGREVRRLIGEKTAEGRDFLAETGRDIYSKGRELYDRGKGLAEDAAGLFDRGGKEEDKSVTM